MPIKIEYQPVAAIADAGMTAGLGQYRQRQQALAIQQRQLEQQAAQFQQGLAARLFGQQQDQMAQQNAQMFQAAKQAQILGWERGNQVADQGLRREQQVADANQRRGWEVADLKGQNELVDERQQRGMDWQWEAKTADQVEQDVNTRMAGYSNQRQFMSEEGKRLLNDLTGTVTAIKKARPGLRPKQYVEKLGEFYAAVERAGLEQYIQAPKTIADRIPDESKTVEAYTPDNPVTGEKGKFAGWWDTTTVTRNGSSQLVRKFVPYKEDTAAQVKTAAQTPDSFESLYSNREQFNKDYTATQKELLSEAKAAAAANGTADGKEPKVSHESVVESMRAKFDAWKSIQPKSQAVTDAGNMGQTPPPPPSAEEQQAAAMAAQARAVMRILEEQQQAAMNEAPRPGPQVTPAATPKKPVNIQDAPKQRREILQSVMPKPATPEEAMDLWPGTRFISPDGTIRKVPAPAQE